MSEIETAGARAGSPRISAIASSKLRTLGGGTGLFAETDGLADAFAEVFASIAASSAPPIDAGQGNLDVDSGQHSGPDLDSDSADSARQESESTNDGEDSGSQDSVVVSVQQEVVDANPEIDPSVSPRQETSDNQQNVDAEQQVDESTLAPVEAAQRNVDSQQLDDGLQQPVQADAHGERRGRRDSEAVDAPEPTEQSNPFGEKRSQSETVPTENGPIADSEGEFAFDPDSQGAGEQGSGDGDRRRSRHDHHDRADRQPQGAEHRPVTNQPASSQQASASLQAASVDAPPPVANDTAPPSQSAVTPARAESAIANVQSVLSRADAASTQARSTVRSLDPSFGTEPGNRNQPQVADAKTKQTKSSEANAEAVSRVKLVQRVSRAFQHLGEDGGVIRLRLAPAEMGSVRVEMRIQQRNVQARVVAETEAASNALKEHLPELRARLESFGMQVESIEIETESQDQQHHSAFSDQDFQRQSNQRENRNWRSRETETPKPEVSPSISQVAVNYNSSHSTGGVDIRL
ncbi:MAG: flagellar hook-length control protein FliK [Rubripirellula sp.]